ncbi:MAG: chromosome segregation protein SMC [Candidatus Aminicenantes bacterium]|nr:chromosome segregation protein SMC [Candidatus Aminicenantes bacterium]
MLIKRLELQGFKTFPDRTKILFNPGITTIIGPNGTGKSNIVEAIQWVLGGHRVKSVRGETIDDAIFTGTTARPMMGMADVSLVLENGNEEMVINHRVFRTGESEYRLGGKVVRLKDIQDELWKRSISENKYFVIEQGAIGTFVTSKPAEKRAFIEEAAGTAYYKDKKRQAERKLEDTEQNLVRLEDIIAEVSKARNSLARQAGAAERYRKVRERVRELTSLHFKKKSAQLEDGRRTLQSEYDASLALERELQARLAAEERAVSERRKEAWDLEQSLKTSAESLYGLRSQAARLEAEREREGKRAEDLAERRVKAASDADELLAEILSLERDLASVGEERAANASALAENDRQHGDFEEARRQMAALVAAKTDEIAALRPDYLEKLAETTAARNEAAKIERELELIRREVEKTGSREAESLARREDARKRCRELIEAQSAAERGLAADEARLASLKDGLSAASSSLTGLERTIREHRDRRDADSFHLQALRKLAEKERSADGPVDAEGALGFFADLVEADPADAVLIDVVWKDEARATVISAGDFLGNLDRKALQGLFLLSPAPPGRDPEAALPADPRVLGTLKTRLRPGSRLAGRMPALADALIVPDIRTAIDLWGRDPGRNFATPDGDVLWSTGLLKLGQKTEGMFTLHQEIRDLERTVAKREEEILPLAAELGRLEVEKARLEDETSQATVTIAGLERDLVQAEKDFSLAEAEERKVGDDLALYGQELEVMALDREGYSRKKEAQSALLAGLEAQEAGLKSRVEEEEKALAALQEKAALDDKAALELRGAADVLRAKLDSLDNLVRALGQRRTAARAKADGLAAEVEASRGEEDRLRTLTVELGAKTAELEARRAEGEKSLAEAESRLAVLRQDLGRAEEALTAAREDYERRKDERVRHEVRKAETDRDLVNLEEACWQELRKSLAEVRAEAAEAESVSQAVEAELEAAREDLARFKAVNLMAEEEYQEQKARHEFLTRQRDDLRSSVAQTKEAILQIDGESRDRFLGALAEINTFFQDLFQALFKGGSAEVRLTDEADPLESGVEVIAQPPGKKVGNMGLLSGGEKSLTSLAFLFALFRYKPTPFCILDEVDAALDEVNLARFLDLMKTIKRETQFIIITHNYKTMEVADFIYGTTMDEPNVTRIFSMRLERKGEAEGLA